MKKITQNEIDIQENFTFDNFSQKKIKKKNIIKLPAIDFLKNPAKKIKKIYVKK